MEYLKSTGAKDPTLKCEVFQWERISNRFSIVDISNIIKIVNMLPLFKNNCNLDNDSHLLNKFIFK